MGIVPVELSKPLQVWKVRSRDPEMRDQPTAPTPPKLLCSGGADPEPRLHSSSPICFYLLLSCWCTYFLTIAFIISVVKKGCSILTRLQSWFVTISHFVTAQCSVVFSWLYCGKNHEKQFLTCILHINVSGQFFCFHAHKVAFFAFTSSFSHFIYFSL